MKQVCYNGQRAKGKERASQNRTVVGVASMGKGNKLSIKWTGTKDRNDSRRSHRKVKPKGETSEYQRKDDQGPGSAREASRNKQERDRKRKG